LELIFTYLYSLYPFYYFDQISGVDLSLLFAQKIKFCITDFGKEMNLM